MKIESKLIDNFFKKGLYFVLFLITLDLLTYFFYPNTIFKDIFFATREQTPLTWVSVILLFLIGIFSAINYSKNKNKIWYILSIIYLFFSIDDAIYFHERLAGSVKNHMQFLEFFPTYIWIIIYAPLLLFALFGMIFVLYKNSTIKVKKLLVTFIILLIIAIILDLIDGYVDKNEVIVFCIDKNCNKSITHLIRLTEESLEVFGFGILAYINYLKLK